MQWADDPQTTKCTTTRKTGSRGRKGTAHEARTPPHHSRAPFAGSFGLPFSLASNARANRVLFNERTLEHQQNESHNPHTLSPPRSLTFHRLVDRPRGPLPDAPAPLPPRRGSSFPSRRRGGAVPRECAARSRTPRFASPTRSRASPALAPVLEASDHRSESSRSSSR